MFIVKRRSELIRFGLFVVLVAGLVWFVAGRIELWRLSQGPGAGPATPAQAVVPKPQQPAAPATGADLGDGSDYFAEFRIERERSRGALSEHLKELMDSPAVDEQVRRQASQQYLELGRVAALEAKAESLVRARGFEDVVVSLAEGSAQVVVKAASVGQQQFVQIVDTVSRSTGVKPGAITVLAKYR